MKIIKHGQEARGALKRGIDLVAKSAKPTLGPAGKVAILGREGLPPRVADDAISVAMNIESFDPIENEAVKMVQEGLMRTSKEVRDSTATTITLIQAFTEALFEKIGDKGSLVKDKVNTIELKKELDAICEEVKKKLKERARKIKKDEIRKIALTAGTYEWIADIVTEVFLKVGKDGYVTIEEGVRTEYEVFNGLEIPAGYHSEYYINGEDKQCLMVKPRILVTNQKLENPAALAEVVQGMLEKKESQLVIVAPEFSRDLLNRLVTTKLNSDFTAVALRLPTFDKDEVLVDIATLTGAKFLDKNTYTDLKLFEADIKLESLGQVERAVVTDTKTVFIDGRGDVSERIKTLKAQAKETQSVFDKDKIEKRIASLSGGIATIKIGGYSDSELGYYKLKLENAVASVENALKEGVVRGGGLALKEIAEDMKPNLITEALKSPYKTIQENNGSPFEVAEDVFDAVINTIGALESARSFAGSILMAETVTAYKDESKDKDEN